MPATPEAQVPIPKKANGRAPISPEMRKRLSDAMKAAHAKNPDAWKRKDTAAKAAAVEKRDNKIRALIKADPDMSYQTIADKLKIHVSRVYRVLRLDGVPRTALGPKRALVAKQREKIRAMLASGLNMNEVARKLGIGQKAVQLARDTPPGSELVPRRTHNIQPSAVEIRHGRIRALLAEGLHPTVIAERMHLNVATVYYVKSKDAGREHPSRLRKRQLYSDSPFAETLNWLRHASQEAYKQVRAGKELTLAECYAIIAYRTATLTPPEPQP